MCQFENICIKNAIFVHFAKFCVPSLWNAYFCSLITFGGVRDFRPDFLTVNNLEAIGSFFVLFGVLSAPEGPQKKNAPSKSPFFLLFGFYFIF